jgi:hypothetical protein
MKLELGDVSPLAGMMTGKGLTGKLIRSGFGGMIPQAIAKDAYSDEEEEKRKRQAAGISSMKKGGKVSSASKRADGCAIKGKTRGKMV